MEREHKNVSLEWTKYAKVYDAIKIGSIDGTDTEPHDQAIIRAINSNYRPPDSKKYGNAKRTIFVGRLNKKTTEQDLIGCFKKFGKIVECRVVRDIVTGHSRCYGFIEFKHKSSTVEAVDHMNSKIIDNCPVLVDYECERTMNGWKPRRLGGGFGGRKESGQLRFGGIDRPFHRPLFGDPRPGSSKEIFRQEKIKKSNLKKKNQ